MNSVIGRYRLKLSMLAIRKNILGCLIPNFITEKIPRLSIKYETALEIFLLKVDQYLMTENIYRKIISVDFWASERSTKVILRTRKVPLHYGKSKCWSKLNFQSPVRNKSRHSLLDGLFVIVPILPTFYE